MDVNKEESALQVDVVFFPIFLSMFPTEREFEKQNPNFFFGNVINYIERIFVLDFPRDFSKLYNFTLEYFKCDSSYQ